MASSEVNWRDYAVSTTEEVFSKYRVQIEAALKRLDSYPEAVSKKLQDDTVFGEFRTNFGSYIRGENPLAKRDIHNLIADFSGVYRDSPAEVQRLLQGALDEFREAFPLHVTNEKYVQEGYPAKYKKWLEALDEMIRAFPDESLEICAPYLKRIRQDLKIVANYPQFPLPQDRVLINHPTSKLLEWAIKNKDTAAGKAIRDWVYAVPDTPPSLRHAYNYDGVVSHLYDTASAPPRSQIQALFSGIGGGKGFGKT